MKTHKIIPLEYWKDTEDKKVLRYDYNADKWILIELRKGSIAGEHYHKGLCNVKDPEVNIITKGKIKYILEHAKEGNKEEIIAEAPCMIEIYPYVQHTLEAMEDSIFIEPFSEEGKDDRFEL